jgi:hypothetical protein
MKPSPAMLRTAAAAARRTRRACAAARRFRPAPLITLSLALVLGGVGGAGAATGGNFLLGKANTETNTATLSNSKGTALKLVAPFGTPPLRVNKTDAEIPNLDAQFAGGYTGEQMVNIGGDGLNRNAAPLDSDYQMYASTGPLPAGIYYVTADAMLFINIGGTSTFSDCRISTASNPASFFGEGAVDQQFDAQIAMTTAVKITSDDSFQEWCSTLDGVGSEVERADITAIRVAFSEGDPPLRAGTSVKHTVPGTSASRERRVVPTH